MSGNANADVPHEGTLTLAAAPVSGVPQHLLEAVFCMLPLPDVIRASAACCAWRDAAQGRVVTAHFTRKFQAGEAGGLTDTTHETKSVGTLAS